MDKETATRLFMSVSRIETAWSRTGWPLESSIRSAVADRETTCADAESPLTAKIPWLNPVGMVIPWRRVGKSTDKAMYSLPMASSGTPG